MNGIREPRGAHGANRVRKIYITSRSLEPEWIGCERSRAQESGIRGNRAYEESGTRIYQV